MFQGLKSKRQLALFVSLVLSSGGGCCFLDSPHAYAADVTGGDVVVDAGHPVPPTPVVAGNAHDIPTATDNRNVVGNKVTIDGVDFDGAVYGPIYGGYTLGTGSSTNNEVLLKGGTTQLTAYTTTSYGGWSEQGNATNNTITLNNVTYATFLHVYGGGSSNTGADVKTGNKLRIVNSKDNWAGTINNFEKMEFELGSKVASGDTMLNVTTYNSLQTFDWSNIKVTNAASWLTGATNSKQVVLYAGPSMTLNNYAISPTVNGDYEYGLRSNTLTPTASTVSADKIFFEGNKFQNSNVTYDVHNPVTTNTTYAGRSTLGNTTKNNKLTIDGVDFYGTLYGGYTESPIGDSTNNEVLLKGGTTQITGTMATIYGGWSEQGNATNNTVTFNNVTYTTFLHAHGGGSSNTGADVKTGNKLRIVNSKDNWAGTINNFEKMEFELGSKVTSGDTMLNVASQYSTQTFDWNNIKVIGLSDWVSHLASLHINNPTLTLYSGPALTLHNYVPELINNAGDYEFGKKANTTATGTVSASVLSIDGNRFQNVTTPTVVGTTVHGGYSSYGNTTNHNDITISSGAYTDTRAGYTDAIKGGSDHNTLNLSGGSVANAYGGYTTGVTASAADLANDPAAKADAKKNTLKISGGTLDAGATAAAGYIATNNALSAASDGDASENTVTITGGTFGANTNIYGGYTEGTGKATKNTVNLEANSLAMGGAFLYGGGGASASDVYTDNTLNVKGKDITVRGVQNFAKMNFDLTGKTVGSTLLNITGGATTGLDWAGVEVTPENYSFTPKSYDKRLFTLMDNAAGISFMKGSTNTYDPIGAKERTNGNYEYVIDTDNHTVHAARYVYVDGFQFKNNTGAAFAASDGTKDAAWAGRTAAGNKVENNKLTVSGGFLTNAYGGYVENNKRASDGTFKTTGDAEANTLAITGGSITGSAYGAEVKTKAGKATGNKVLFSGGSVTNHLYGGAVTGTGAAGEATGNTVTLTGASTVGGNLYGGYTSGTGATTGNTVNLGDGTVAGVITTGSVTGTIYGGNKTDATNNVLNVNSKATAGNIAHFGKLNFNFNSTIQTGDTMLTLNGGAATALDWGKFGVGGSDAPDGETTLMHNAAGITISNYDHSKAVSNTGTKEYVIYTDTGNDAGVRSILYGGYTYKGKNTTPLTSNASADIWAGRSVVGNTTTENELTINGTNHRDAYGGWTVGEGTSAAGDARNNSIKNTVNLKNGTVRNIYGGFTSSTGGKVTDNKVNISGGSATGTVYGGHISHTSAGDATGNTVTITGGSMHDVYAGYTNGTGATTGNTVNLGDGTNALASVTTIAGTLYGGNKAVDTGNTLNVNTNATVGNIKHFQKLSFNLDGNINAANPLLTLSDGNQTTGLDWDKVEVTGGTTFTPSTYNKRLFTLMHNANGISFMKNGVNTYAPIGAKDRTNGDFEFVIDTDNHTVNAAQDVYVDGFRFRNNTAAAYTAGDGSHTEGWAGRTAVGNKVEKNKLTVSGGTLTTAAYGGLVENNKLDGGGNPITTGDAAENTLAVTGGSIANGYGAKVTTKDGAATKNIAELSGGSVTGDLYGAAITAAGATKSATENEVKLSGGSVTNNVYGGALTDAGATGSATGNKVTLTGAATVGGDVYAGYTAGNGATTGNTVNLGDKIHTFTGSVTGTVHGGSNAGDVTDNTLNINTNANVGNIKNFDKLVFDLNTTVNQANTMLNLTGNTATNDLDWRKLSVTSVNMSSANIKTYEPYKIKLMENTNGINFVKGSDNTYTLGGGAKSGGTGNLEYVIDTNNHSGTLATSVNLEGYQFKDNTAAAYTTADGIHAEAWAGRTKIGNTVTNNTLTVSGGTLTTAAYGGLVENTKRDRGTGQYLTTGNAAKNTLALTGGSIVNGYGADVRTKDGRAEENAVTISGGNATGSVYGAALTAAGATGEATKNSVTVSGGSVTGDVVGGALTQADAAGNATGNTAAISAGTVGGTVYGGKNAGTGAATGNKVTVTGGTLHDIYGGHTASGATTGNVVNLGTATDAIAAGTTVGNIYGGNQTAVTGNELNVYDSVTAANVDKFEKVNFNVTSNVATGDTLLTLSNGAASHIDWKKMTLNNLNALIPSNTTGHLLTLVNSTNNMAFDNYTDVGAIERHHDGDYEYVIDTDTHSGSAKKVDVTGYRFQNNTGATYTSGTVTEAWGGRSRVGNTVTNNKLTVSGGSVTTAAYGGIAENYTKIVGGTERRTGDATHNTLVLNTGASVAGAYGADVRTWDGNATNNTVELAGGTVNGNLYGGALTHAGATGNATNNTVTIKGGTVSGDVYAGFTNGAGATTHNTVNIGDGTNPIAAGTSVTGTIYGGSGAAATGNVLNVNAKGLTAGSVANFEKIKFKIDSNVNDGDNVLTLTNNTNIVHSTIEEPTSAIISDWLGNTMEKTAHLIKMNGGTLTLTGYTSGTSRRRAGDVEYVYKTDNDLAATTGSLDLSAYKWQNANVVINNNAHTNVFGGKSTLGTTGETLNNKLKLTSGASVTNAIGGDTQTANGTATGNKLTVEAGAAVTNDAIGGKTLAGLASGNTATINAGSAANLKGAYSASGKVQENVAEVNGGSVTTALGAESTAGASVKNRVNVTNGTATSVIGGRGASSTEDSAVISGGTVTNATGGYAVTGDAASNAVAVSGGTVGTVRGAQAAAGKAVKNTVVLSGGSVTNAIGAEAHGDADENAVVINAAATAGITGAISTNGNAAKNTVDVNAAVTGNILGAHALSGNATESMLNINANVTGNVTGAQASGSASNNTINIGNVTVTGNVTGGSGATTTNNTINLKGATVTGDVVGGSAGDAGNTLAVHYNAAQPTSRINDFSNIKKLHFYLGEDVSSNTPTLLQLGVLNKNITNVDVGVGVKGNARSLSVNDTISLMKTAPGGTLTMNLPTQENKVSGMQGVSLLYEFSLTRRNSDELIATVLKAAINDQTKSFVETRAAATDFINRGADLLAGSGLSAAKRAAAGGENENEADGYHIWAAFDQGAMRAETGSYADTKGYNLSLGWARELAAKDSKTIFTPFVEYGNGTYDSYLDDGTHGSGKISYLGAGVMGRVERPNGFWAEAALHGGRAKSDYAGSVYAGTTSTYDSSNSYYAAHFGIGKEFDAGAKAKLNTYLRYFYSRQTGTDATLNSGEEYNFGDVASSRVRVGATYTHRDSEKSKLYAGLACEYEFDGSAGASFQGFDTPSPSLRGASYMLELGYRFAPKGSRLSYDLHLRGWQGKRQGITGGGQINWAF